MKKEKRLIDANALITEIAKAQNSLLRINGAVWQMDHKYYKGLDWARRIVIDAPAVDAVEAAEYDAVVYKLECLLCHATGGMYSKAGYSWENMERMVTDYIEECCREAVDEEVVRCKDCKYCRGVPASDWFEKRCSFHGRDTHPEDFCSYGERS